MHSVKIASTRFPVLDIIKNRWSPRAFSDKEIADELLATLFEAASWAASANNEQPWQYIYAKKGSGGFENVWNCLMPGNQPWAKHAGCFLIAVAKTDFEGSGKINPYAHHDLGMANAHLLLQAASLDIYGHVMAGFDKTALTEAMELTANQEAVCVIALGYLAAADTLEEPYKTRELTARSRKNISTFTFQK